MAAAARRPFVGPAEDFRPGESNSAEEVARKVGADFWPPSEGQKVISSPLEPLGVAHFA